MNAYELADFINAGGENIDRNKLADILRQQAARIAHLEILVANRNEIIDKLDLTTPQIKERCEPLCKPSVCNCIKKELSDAIKIIEELRVDADMNYKDYENTYADGWDDAFNEILSALYERDGIK